MGTLIEKEEAPTGVAGLLPNSMHGVVAGKDHHCRPGTTLRSFVNPCRRLRAVANELPDGQVHAKRKKPRGEWRGFFQNVHVERDVMARGEAITTIGLSLPHCCGAVILSHDQTRRTQELSASRARDASPTLPSHYRFIAGLLSCPRRRASSNHWRSWRRRRRTERPRQREPRPFRQHSPRLSHEATPDSRKR